MQKQTNNTTHPFNIPSYLLFIFTLTVLTTGTASSQTNRLCSLFSEEDAALMRYNDAEWEQMLATEIPLESKSLVIRSEKTTKGPVIELLIPKVTAKEIITLSPAAFHLQFKSTDNPIDMSSLKIIGRKFLLSKDLTGELAPFISGQEMKAKSVAIPEGKFVLDVEIADTMGVITTQRYKLIVKKS